MLALILTFFVNLFPAPSALAFHDTGCDWIRRVSSTLMELGYAELTHDEKRTISDHDCDIVEIAILPETAHRDFPSVIERGTSLGKRTDGSMIVLLTERLCD